MTTETCDSLAPKIVAAIESVIGPNGAALHEPRFGQKEAAYLQECLASTYVSSVGPFVDRLERSLASYTGAKYAIAVVNGTAALEVALRLAGVNPGDEVLTPTLTFVATANAVMHCGAMPHFVDSEQRHFGIDVARLKEHLLRIGSRRNGLLVNRITGRTIKSLLPMHVFGHPVDMDPLMELANEFGLTVVEDAAEALGSRYKGRHCGTIGNVGTLSFNGNKIVTTGGGGAILTNDASLAARAKHLTTTAKLAHRWEYRHDQVAYNYRMPNLNAALGCAQLEQLDAFVDAKRALFHAYQTALKDVPQVDVLQERQDSYSNYWLQTLILHTDWAGCRDLILDRTNDAGIKTRPVWVLLHRLRPYQDCFRMELAVAESLERRIINLPSSPFLAKAQFDRADIS